MSIDLFGMAVENRKSIKELIIVSSPRIDYHTLLDAARYFIPPLLFNNLHLISLDKSLINGLLVCKHCHMLFTDTRSNRPVFIKHLTKFHGVERKPKEPKPEPTIPIQFTETPVTVNLVEPDKVTGNDNTESGNPSVLGPQVAAQAKTPDAVVACASTQSVRKSHHKKKITIKCLPQPVLVPQCVDSISDQKYIPSPPYPLVSEDPNEWVENWEAPLDKKPKSQKRKSPATTGSNTVDKKKATKKIKVAGEWKATLHEQKTSPELPNDTIPIMHFHARPPPANKTPKALATSSKEAQRKQLGW